MSDIAFDPIDPVLGEFRVLDGGGHHTGQTIRFEQHGVFAHSVARDEKGFETHGLAAIFRGRLLIATGPKDKVEIGAYHLSGNQLEGIWVPPGAKGCDMGICGRERSRRGEDSLFHIEQAHAIDQMPYAGSLRLDFVDPDASHLRRVRFHWRLHDGEYTSFGIAVGELLATTFNFEPQKPYAIAVYEPHGPEWAGVRACHDSEALLRESLRR